MKPLNITYYFGQIREEYKGRNALFMEVNLEGKPEFEMLHLDSDELSEYTGGMHSPMRSYIGVNQDAQPELQRRFEKGDLRSAFDLDVQIVREEIAKRRLEEVSDLKYASLSAAVATGK